VDLWNAACLYDSTFVFMLQTHGHFLAVTTRALEYYDNKVLECVTRQYMISNSFISDTGPVWS